MKKLLTILVALALLACPMAFAEEPVTLTVAVADKTNVEDYNTNLMTLYIEEQLNVDLQFQVYASTDYNTKINIKVQSGDELEDIILGTFGDGLVFQWAQEGAIAPLTKYYKDASTAPNLFEAFERTGYDFRGDITLPDGEIYYIPVYNQSYGNEYQAKFWYNPAWLEQLGEDLPETIDELRDLLSKVVATDLNNNGEADEIGIADYDGINGRWFSYLMNAFTYYDHLNDHMVVHDGTVSFAYTDEKFREGVLYIADMIAEGLIASESITQDNATWKNMINASDHSTFIVPYTTPSQILDLELKSKYVAMPPVKGPDDVCFSTFNPSKANCGMVISAGCENIEKAFEVGDLLTSELMGITQRWGQKGQDWDYVSETADPSQYAGTYSIFGAVIVVYDDAKFWSSGGMQNRSWMQTGPFVRQYGIAAGRATKVGSASDYDLHIADGDILYQTGGFAPAEYISKLIYSEDEQAVVTKISEDLNTYVNETVSGWLLDSSKLTDDAWNAFLEGVSSLGAEEWLECAQAAYDRSQF